MTNRAEQFIDQMSGAIELMMDRAPKDLCICFSVYARDPLDRAGDEPDGVIRMSSAARGGYFDKATFKEYVNSFYSKDRGKNQ